MPTFKNISVPVGKSGKTRLQRVQVLKSGKFKFVKNIVKPKKKVQRVTATRRHSTSRSVTRTANSKVLRVYSPVGALEDVAWGFIGFNIMGKSVAALPITRAIQGLAGHAFDRRGKGRLVYALIDILTIALSGKGAKGRGGISDDLTQLMKFKPLKKFSKLV